ncbi:LCP family protein [Glycomyces xiaoerkulensis]|uniref:LCP family protein n=1 Tax=Glycomyces xiaoerkulensis TaxID=2038139 RepID=UPI000C25DB41|nr:LCP family protein [Glycomyces xiaoerkulensis]
MAGRTRAPWWAHLMLYTGGLTTVAAGGAAAVTQYGVSTANSAVEDENILNHDRAEIEDVENLTGPLDVLVLGVDEEDDGSPRSDTMIMVHVNADLTEATMVSLPRDLWVPIPDCGPAWGGDPCEFKLNHAASISDEWAVARSNVVAAIDDLTGVDFHLAATADFNGFLDLVDLVGEIELCPPHEITSIHTGTVFPGECAYYGKDDALDLVRQRKGWGDQDHPEDWENGWGGDYGRQKMQQQAIKSLLEEAKAQGFHKDPGKVGELLSGFGDSVKLDRPDGMEVVDLVVGLRDIDPGDIDTIQVPSKPETIVHNGKDLSIVRIHDGEERVAADALWEALRTDTVDQWTARYPEWVKQDD